MVLSSPSQSMVPAPAVDTLTTALFRARGSVDLVWENAIFRGSGPPSRRMTKPESDMAKQTGPASGRRKTARNAERRKRVKKDTRAVLGLPVLHADTAGIDIGATEIYVAVPADRDEEPVRCFGGFTADLRDIATWLGQCGVKRVAMESTGVYWIPLWQVLADEGFEVCLVNARHFKEAPRWSSRGGTTDRQIAPAVP